MPLTLDERLQTNPNVIFTELTDCNASPEAVLLNIATQKYFSLNATGIRIWKVLEQRLPLSSAVTELTETFDVTRERAEASVLSLAEDLSEADLIGPVEALI